MSKLTYISLFSSAGVGCYGFKMEGFHCIATNEIIERRLDIQRFNRKCKYEAGYICGDITRDDTKDLIRHEIARWKNDESCDDLDVLIATPPCQGMSVANHKKSDTEIIRNSLVVESIKLIKELKPRIFIFENVPAFMKTICTDLDMHDKPIAEARSPDNSGSICDQYAQTDSRITVLHKKNEGVSAARNDGMEKAQGEYLLFIDADDGLAAETLSGNATYMDNRQMDLIEYPAIYNYQDSSERKMANPNREITGKKACQAYISTCNRYEVWSFFIRKAAIQDIRFKTHVRIGEDTIFLYELLSNVKKVAVSEKGCYHHYKNNGSVMNSLSTSEKEKTKVLLLSELYHATAKHQQMAIAYFYPYFRQLHHHEIESQELKNKLEELLHQIHWRAILTSPLALKSRMLILWMHLSQLIHRKS